MNYPFCYEPDSLSLLAVEGVKSYILNHPHWLPVLQEGKMFGILVVEKDGALGYLAAYSGQIVQMGISNARRLRFPVSTIIL